ncbi:hypothetical protein [Glaciimonas soli]|uniref:Mor transcription activator domain-containing protein n=1 Tax=Glaciimonas soli TaxID=2590999 RepID=A0A843YXE8_9BURK|nr:hypothetical protein [Glaciimonas soli]MQR02344.1 hypothetical protein [Glaciimonas soli]
MTTMERPNTNLDDIANVIGFSATLRITAWFGGSNLYIPGHAYEQHAVAKLIGLAAFKRLVEEWGNEHLTIPINRADEVDRRNRHISDLMVRGMGAKEIAFETGLHERRIQQLRRQLEESGLVPMVMYTKPPQYFSPQNCH